MFKYFVLVFDYFLAICYEISISQFSFFVLIPPILHTLTFLVQPHCYANHCKLKHKTTHKQQQPIIFQDTPQKVNEFGQVDDYFSPFKLSQPILSLPSGTPSPSPFQLSSNKKPDQLEQNRMSDHITKPKIQKEGQYQICKQCGLTKWIRMHHCYYCQVCVHKYDHHCILLGICIGEANQKYYLPFLLTFLFSSLMQAFGYYQIIQSHIWVDEKGYEHTDWAYVGMSLAIIFFILSIFIVGYLSVYHTYLMLYNDTTYQIRKRNQIYYFKGIIRQHPFDKGMLQNIKIILTAKKDSPIQWQKPQKQKIGINIIQRKPQRSSNQSRKRKSLTLAQRRGYKVEQRNININKIKNNS